MTLTIKDNPTDSSLSFIYSINSQKQISSLEMNSENEFRIENILLIAQPGSTVDLVFTSESILIPDKDQCLSSIYNFTAKIHLRQCYKGEIFTISIGSCDPCPPDMYSFDNKDVSCKLCLEGLTCFGRNKLLVKTGYWREDEFTEEIIKCDNTGELCIGGKASKNQLCGEGQIGPKCESCDVRGEYWGDFYGRRGKYSCGACAGNIQIYLTFFLLAAVNFFYMGLSVKSTLDNLRVKLAWQLNLISRFSMIPERVNEASFYIKIYMTYIQIIMIVTTFKISHFRIWIRELLHIWETP